MGTAPVVSVTMIGSARPDRRDPIQLLEKHQQRKFVLKGQRRKSQQPIAGVPQLLCVTIGRSNQKCGALHLAAQLQ